MIYLINTKTKEHIDAMTLSDAEYGCLAGSSGWIAQMADPGGWIEWHGGECPLPDDAYTDYKMRDGRISSAHASWLRWDNSEDIGEGCPEADIIAYRPTLDAKFSHPGTMAGLDKYRAAGGEWPAWDGVGMPRAGALACTSGGECEVVTTDGARGQVCVRWNDGELGVVPIGAVKPRPIRSEEDRTVEQMAMDLVEKDADAEYTMDGLRALYRAGYRKTGGE